MVSDTRVTILGYQTKDSGERQQYPTGMVRDTNEGKPRFDLLIPKGIAYEEAMITRWAALLARGAEKYTERNWEKASTVEEYERFKESAFRHFIQWHMDEVDEDHGSAVFFNIQGAEYVKGKI